LNRDPASIGIQGYLALNRFRTPQEWVHHAKAWKDLGCTHLSLDTIKAGLSSFDEHLDILRRFHDAVAPVVGAT
jgi:ATP sulfurylase